MKILSVIIILILSLVFIACQENLLWSEKQIEEKIYTNGNQPPDNIPPVPHDIHIFGEWFHTDATCTESAAKKRACTICKFLETIPEGEPLGHIYGDNWRIINQPHSGRAGVEAQVCIRDTSHTGGEQRIYSSVVVNPPSYKEGEIETVGAVGNTTKTFITRTDVRFTATVKGENPLQTVNWSISGKNLTNGTTIDGDGLLTINAVDRGKEITVTAESTVDTTKKGSTSVVAAKYLPSALAGTWFNYSNFQTFVILYNQDQNSKIFYYEVDICSPNMLSPVNKNYYHLYTLSWEYVFSTGTNSSNFPEGYKVKGRQSSAQCHGCNYPIGNCITGYCNLNLELCVFSNNNRLRYSGNGNLTNTSDFIKLFSNVSGKRNTL